MDKIRNHKQYVTGESAILDISVTDYFSYAERDAGWQVKNYRFG